MIAAIVGRPLHWKVTPSWVSPSILSGLDVQSSARDVFLHRCATDDLRHTHDRGTAKRLLKGAIPNSGRKRPQDLIPNGIRPIRLAPQTHRPAFPLVRGCMVGLPGLEPGTSSLSEMDG